MSHIDVETVEIVPITIPYFDIFVALVILYCLFKLKYHT